MIHPHIFPHLMPIEDLMTAWYGFSEGDGAHLHDVSGHAQHGDLTNMDTVADWIAGEDDGEGFALDFDGTNDHVEVFEAGSGGLGAMDEGMMFYFSQKLDAYGAYSQFVSNTNAYAVSTDNGHGHNGRRNYSGNNADWWGSGDPWDDGYWRPCIFNHERSVDLKTRIYLITRYPTMNQSLDVFEPSYGVGFPRAGAGTINASLDNPPFIGSTDTPGNYLNGKMADLKFVSRDFDAEQRIRQHEQPDMFYTNPESNLMQSFGLLN